MNFAQRDDRNIFCVSRNIFRFAVFAFAEGLVHNGKTWVG